jgi:hypothetical protein
MAITGDVRSLVQAINGHVFAGTSTAATIWRSTDDGLNWTSIQTLGSGGDVVNAFARNRVSGTILAAVSGGATAAGIWRSTNNGASWTKVLSPVSGTNGYVDITNFQGGYRFAAVAGIGTSLVNSPVVYSTDDGSTWSIIQMPYYYRNHMSIAAYDSPVLYTQYPTETWGDSVFFIGIDGNPTAVNGLRYAQTSGPVPVNYGNYDGGIGNGGKDMVSFVFKSGGQYFRQALWATRAIADVTDTEVWKFPGGTYQSGSTVFIRLATIQSKQFVSMYVDATPDHNSSTRTIWAGLDGEIMVSRNSGVDWEVTTTTSGRIIYAFWRTTSGVLLAAGEGGVVYRFTGSGGGNPQEPPPTTPETPPPTPDEPGTATTRFLGRTETTDDEVYVSNKFGFNTITHILHYNGSTYTNLQFGTALPYYLLGTTAAVGKAAYFGSQSNLTNVPGGPFSSLVFDITQPNENITAVWEYWNGAAWTTLTTHDNSNTLKAPGVHSVHWHPPATWAATAVDGITAFWVRLRTTAVGAGAVVPIHDNRYIYTVLNPYIEIGDGVVGGDVPALARIQWKNRADNAASTVAMEADRVIVGLRSVERGPNFQAYLNVSDEFPPFGVVVTAGVESAWSNVNASPSGRALTVSYASAPNLNVWNNLVSFSLASTVGRDYYGTYRAFVRGYKPGATANQWQVRVRVTFGSGGGSADSKIVFPTPVADWEVWDIGQVSVPTTLVAQQGNNIGDVLTISIQGKCTTLSADLTLYDLILIPVDEWVADAYPPKIAVSMTSQIKSTNMIDLDSISNPKSLLSALNRNEANLIVARYQARNNGPAILQAGQQQRLWFLEMATTGTYWYGYPALAGTVQVFRQQRYLGLRGES